MIKVGSDCSGIGSFLQALERIGIDYVESFSCDFDYYARVIYCLNFGTEQDLELALSKEHKEFCTNVKEIALKKGLPTESELEILKAANDFAKKFSFYYPFNMYDREIPNESCDIYIGSFPCQAFSLSGKRLGEKDKRGIVFYSGHEFIQKNKPRYFIIENVKGLLSDNAGKTFNNWLELLGGKSINGKTIMFPNENSVPYHIHYQVLNAKHYGVPQNRERVFIIGIRDDEDNSFKFPKKIPLVKRLKDVLEKPTEFDSTDSYEKYMKKYFLSQKMIDGFIDHKERQEDKGTGFKWNPRDVNSVATCIRATPTLAATDNTIVEGFINQDTQASQVFSDDGISPSICAGTHGYANGYVNENTDNVIVEFNLSGGKWDKTHEQSRRVYNTEGIAPTIPTMGVGNQEPKIVEENNYGNKRLNETLEQNEIPDEDCIIDCYNKTIHTDVMPSILTIIGSANMHYVKLKTNNKKGFDIAEEEEDSINFSNPKSETRRGRVGKKVAQTIETSPTQAILQNKRIRKLTPTEVYRLMDFNQDFIEKTIGSGLISDSQLYKTGGNSICVGVLSLIINNFKL